MIRLSLARRSYRSDLDSATCDTGTPTKVIGHFREFERHTVTAT